MKAKCFGLILALLFYSTTGSARPSPDAVGLCYVFKGDEVVKRDICIITSGNAAGGIYTNLQLGDKTYEIYSHGIDGKNSDGYNFNGQDSEHYLRDASFFNVSTYEELNEINEPALYCYKTKNIDICHN